MQSKYKSICYHQPFVRIGIGTSLVLPDSLFYMLSCSSIWNNPLYREWG